MELDGRQLVLRNLNRCRLRTVAASPISRYSDSLAQQFARYFVTLLGYVSSIEIVLAGSIDVE